MTKEKAEHGHGASAVTIAHLSTVDDLSQGGKTGEDGRLDNGRYVKLGPTRSSRPSEALNAAYALSSSSRASDRYRARKRKTLAGSHHVRPSPGAHSASRKRCARARRSAVAREGFAAAARKARATRPDAVAGGAPVHGIALDRRSGAEVLMAVRTVHLRLERARPETSVNAWPARIRQRVFQGDFTQYHVDWDGRQLIVRVAAAAPMAEGDEVFVSVEPRHCVLLED